MSRGTSRLLELLRQKSVAHHILKSPPRDIGLAEVEPFPFLAIVGQQEMKLSLILAVINPMVGGVLLMGSRGTAKTSAVRALGDLLPPRRESLCPNGCTEESLERSGLDGICLDCAKKVGYGEALTVEEKVRIVELPLNSRLEDVIGGIDERLALEQQRVRLERGILSQADGNILYIDEVNMLADSVTVAILDAAAHGYYTVRRGTMNLQYRSRFVFVGSMNPEEGHLRPQLLDRFGLRAVIEGLSDPELRYQAYKHATAYRRDPEAVAASYAEQTFALADEIVNARQLLPEVEIGDESKAKGLSLIQAMKIDSNRAEITLFEASRAYAAADGRTEVTPDDIAAVAPLSLRLRQSVALGEFFRKQQEEESQLQELLRREDPLTPPTRS